MTRALRIQYLIRYVEELNPITMIAALFVSLEAGGLRNPPAGMSFGGGGSLLTLREGLYTKELPILEDSDKSKQIFSAAALSYSFSSDLRSRGFAEVQHF